MKKIFIAAIAVLALCCSCSKDKCKCTIVTENPLTGKTTQEGIVLPKINEDKTCAQFAAERTHDLGEAGSVKYTCTAAAKDAAVVDID